MRALLLPLCLILAGARSAPAGDAALPLSDEKAVAADIEAEVSQVLERLLGPGRARVMVRVEGQRREQQTQTEITTPIKKQPDSKSEMPGYWIFEKWREKPVEHLQKDSESSVLRRSYQIDKLQVSILLDTGVGQESERAVRSIIPKLLRMDETRGDDLVVVRAPLLPEWRLSVAREQGTGSLLRYAMALAGGVVLVVLLGIFLYITLVRAARVFAAELMARRAESAPGAAPPARLEAEEAAATAEDVQALPEGIPALTGGKGRTTAEAALEQGFEFLTRRPAAEVASALDAEPPEELALLFSHLAESRPEQASSLFMCLPENLQDSVSQSMAKLKTADPERLSQLEDRLRETVENLMRGPQRLGKILSRLPSQRREEVLGTLTSKDPAAAAEVESGLFPFERIGSLKREDLRRVLAVVPFEQWGVALRGAPEEFVERVLTELPPGWKDVVQEAVQIPQKREEVLSIRSRILNGVLAMAQRGQVSLSSQPGAGETV